MTAPHDPSDGPATVICTYRVQPGKEDAFVELLRRHWPELHRMGLTTDTPSKVFRGEDEPGKTYFVEIFTWIDGGAAERAHQVPEVMAVWEPMGAIVEERGGRPAMEFPHVDPFDLNLATA